MKNTFFLLVFIIAGTFSSSAQNTGHKITFNIKNLNDSAVYIARYYGGKQYMVDTIVTLGKEKFVYEGEEALDCGLYMLVREKKSAFFDFIIDDQFFGIETDTIDFNANMKFKNSKDNELLYEYVEISNRIGKSSTELKKEIKKLEDQGSKENLESKKNQLKKNSDEMESYISKFKIENPDHFLTVVFGIMSEVEFPEYLKEKPDSISKEDYDRKRYNYYLNHYFDGMDFSSNCLLRTPTFHGKMQQYFDKFVPQHYDSVPKYAEMLVEKAKGNPENFKYILNYLTFKWETGKEKRMCWDKVFHHLAKKYYVTGQTPWVDLVQLEKIKERVKSLEPCLCGEKAVPFQMNYKDYKFPSGLYDTNNVYHDFTKMKEDYVILWFWDSDCGHCKKQTPKLWDAYEKYKKLGKSIEVYAINLENESKGYKKYLRGKNYSWINVQDTFHLSKFREHYDIYSTPVSFLLDKERKIIAKRVDPEAMDRLLEQIFQEEEEKKNKPKTK